MRKLEKHLFVVCLAAAGCLPRGRRIEYDELARSRDAPVPARGEDSRLQVDEASLEKEARLETILRLALARNPDLLEGDERVRERLQRIPPSARLPDPELKFELWGVPLARPHAIGRAETIMIGVRQTFPAPGSLDAAERAAVEDAGIALQAVRTRGLQLKNQVEHAYHEYFLSDREYRLHLEHVELTERTLDLVRSRFRAGGASEQDVLRAALELQGLHRDIASIEQRRRSAAALLNALMGRDARAPLGAPADLDPVELAPASADLAGIATQKRPEVMAAAHAVKRSQSEVSAAQAEATWPSFMVGADYWHMPTMEEKHAYGAMLSINLPWLNPGHREEVRAAKQATSAERRALVSVENTVRYEVVDAQARYSAARTAYLVTRDELVPLARRSFDAARAAFDGGKGSALALVAGQGALLQARLDELRERVDLDVAIADLERAVGTDLAKTAIGPQGAHP